MLLTLLKFSIDHEVLASGHPPASCDTHTRVGAPDTPGVHSGCLICNVPLTTVMRGRGGGSIARCVSR